MLDLQLHEEPSSGPLVVVMKLRTLVIESISAKLEVNVQHVRCSSISATKVRHECGMKFCETKIGVIIY